MSIFKKITILFIISFILMGTIGLWVDSINSNKIDRLIKEKYIKISQEILKSIENKTKLEQVIKKYNLKHYDKIKQFKTLYLIKNSFGYIKISKEFFDNELILEINYLDETLTYETTNLQSLVDQKILNLLIIVDIVLLIIIFLFIFKLLNPLKIVTKKLKEFSDGRLDSRIDINSNDEIGVLAKSFNSMATTLQKNIKTKEEILREIAHELRTPIAKGKFVIHNNKNNEQNKILNTIFNDLETLTSNIIEIEKLNINSLEVSTFSVETLVIEALQKVYLDDEEQVKIKIENFNIKGDLYFLTIALKNLISNGLKYTTKLPIIIEAKDNEILVKSYGQKLEKTLDYYTQAFTKENKKDGFGLGLNIVSKIILKHNFVLSYNYKDKMNIFSLYI